MAEAPRSDAALPLARLLISRASLIGRDAEVSAVSALLATIDQPGSIGTDARAQEAVPFRRSWRESVVLCVVVADQSDRAIADALVTSWHTVSRHVSNILGVRGIASRVVAAPGTLRDDLV
jgi:DNA-binding NarL/FixJ family response regulator